jgi:TRAP-type C4-dicarboxylate transport system permease small subunit
VQAAEKLLKALGLVEKAVIMLAFAVMAGALMADVLSREFFGRGIFGAPQVGVFAMIVMSFLGIGLASAAGAHLRPRFADRLVPRRWDPFMDRLAEFLFALFCALFGGIAVLVVQESLALGDVAPVLRWPIWPFQAVIAAAFFIAALRHFLFGLFPPLKPVAADAAQARE